MTGLFKGNDWKISGVFPRVTFCDVKITVCLFVFYNIFNLLVPFLELTLYNTFYDSLIHI